MSEEKDDTVQEKVEGYPLKAPTMTLGNPTGEISVAIWVFPDAGKDHELQVIVRDASGVEAKINLSRIESYSLANYMSYFRP